MASPVRHLSLVVPGLLGPVDLIEPGQLPALQALPLLLRRSLITPSVHNTLESQLFALFPGSTVADELPVAPFSYLADSGLSSTAWCMRADPVFMVPGQNSLMLMASGDALQLSQAEALAIEESLNLHFRSQGVQFHAASPSRWYCFAQQQRVETTSLRQVQGRAVQAHMPRGEDGVFWNAVLAEAQMLLYQHPVNQNRQLSGLPQINSLWLWGEGSLPGLPKSRWQQVWGREALCRGLAHVSARPQADSPQQARDWLDEAAAGEHLLVLEHLLAALPDLSQSQWSDYIVAMESVWFAPLLQALQQRQLASLSLYPLNGHVYTLTRSRLQRWWLRPRPLLGHLQLSDYE